MCSFCHKHGDGKKWYLQAKSYAADLSSDLRRRKLIADLLGGIANRGRESEDQWEAYARLPRPLKRLVAGIVSRYMQRRHFGQPVPLEDCARIFEIASSIIRVPCACRISAGQGHHAYCLGITAKPLPEDDALLISTFPDYARGPDASQFERLTPPEALALLRSFEAEGLMHSVWTFGTPFIAGLCNCSLPAGCLAMRSTLEYGVKMMWKGEYVTQVSWERCTGCGACAKLCPFGAIYMDRGARKAVVRVAECWGCGVCRASCGSEALQLLDRAAVPEVARSW